jgi:hypothetical protein
LDFLKLQHDEKSLTLVMEQLRADLADLKGLVDEGIITEDDFARQKEKLLDAHRLSKSAPAPPQAFPVVSAEFVKSSSFGGKDTASARSVMTNSARADAKSCGGKDTASARSVMTNSARYTADNAPLDQPSGLEAMCSAFGASMPLAEGAGQSDSDKPIAKLCFLVDCTGSMSHAINGVRDILVDILEESTQAFPGIALEFGFVGYRDYGDKPQFEVFPFTGEIVELAKQINKVRATGGDDEAEDVLGGMETALTGLDWSGARFKVMVHIGDAPAHGSRFHDPSVGCNDNHQDKENCPRPSADILGDYADNHIDYHFALMESGRKSGLVTTNHMAEVFKEEYDQKQSRKRNFTVMDLQTFSTEGLFSNVLKGLTGSIAARLGSKDLERLSTRGR